MATRAKLHIFTTKTHASTVPPAPHRVARARQTTFTRPGGVASNPRAPPAPNLKCKSKSATRAEGAASANKRDPRQAAHRPSMDAPDMNCIVGSPYPSTRHANRMPTHTCHMFKRSHQRQQSPERRETNNPLSKRHIVCQTGAPRALMVPQAPRRRHTRPRSN